MSLLQKMIATSDSKEYYTNEINKLKESKKIDLENLLQKMHSAGAKKPLSWALSEVTENIPQFGRFLFLKGLFEILNDVEENMTLADDIDEKYEKDIFEVAETIENVIGKKALNNFLKSYTKGVMWQVTNHIDEGNYNTKGEKTWSLKEANNQGAGRCINGLHENLNNFEEELIKL